MKKNHHPCLIIGAGMAGLAAANHLRENGVHAPILEARNYSGGRISVHRNWGMPLARGAHWIHGGQDNPMLALAKQFSTPLLPFTRDHTYRFTQTGKPIPAAIATAFNDQFETALSQAKNIASELQTDTALDNVLKPLLSSLPINEYSHALMKSRFKFFENYMGAGAEQLSAKYWDIAEPGAEENFRVLDAFESIIDGLTKPCDIQFNSVVKKINYAAHPIEITTNTETVYADSIILTVPLGVLKSQPIEFYPALPAPKQTAIANLAMGVLDLAVLQFSEPFLPEGASIIFIENQSPTACSTFLNMHPAIQQPIIYGYTGGKTACAVEKLPDAVIIDQITTTLKQAFGKKVPDVTRSYVTRWMQDPFSCGSYSYTPVGATAEDYVALAKPIDQRIFFAGEATNAHQYDATTHGAYFSGIQAAADVLLSISGS